MASEDEKEEIKAVKDDVHSLKEKVRLLEAECETKLTEWVIGLGSDYLSEMLKEKGPSAVEYYLDEKLKVLQAERASRNDPEMNDAVLKTEEAIYKEDMDKILLELKGQKYCGRLALIEKKKIDKDGFSLVHYERKRKKHSKETLNANDSSSSTSGILPLPENFGDVMKNIQDELKCSDFIVHFQKDLFMVLAEWNLIVSPQDFMDTPSISEISPSLSKKCSDIDIICYGLGQFSSSYIARYQLGFLLVLQHILHSVHVYVYDPEFSVYEIDFLKQLGFNVLEVNEECKRTLNRKSVFFMPHCDLHLYNNLLWANWNAKKLSELVIIGNSFANYELYNYRKLDYRKLDYKILRFGSNVKLPCIDKYVFMANKFVTEIKMTNIFRLPNIFSETSLHYFKSSSLSMVDSSVWTDSEEPEKYTPLTKYNIDSILKNYGYGLSSKV